MKKSVFQARLIPRAAAALAALALVCAAVAGCSNKKPADSIIEYKNYGISREFYEFTLSKWKGELARNKYDVAPASEFWNTIIEDENGNKLTVEESCNQAAYEMCKNYLAAVILFDREGLKLSDDTIAEIDAEIEDHIAGEAQGSEKKLDAILSKYGTDTEGLRDIYIIEAKYRAVMNFYYGAEGSLISDAVKQEYYEQNYHRFKQIFVSDYYYKYQTDEQGNVIYFDPETAKPIYDTENGKVIYVDGYSIKDEFEQPIYYDDAGKILYDTENGLPTPEIDGDGKAITYKYTEQEMNERIEQMNLLQDRLENGNFAAFEAEMPSWELYEGTDDYYPDGYYLSHLESDGYYGYVRDILSALEDMNVGEIKTVESENGYHIIMKYELDDGKFKNEDYAEWFDGFNESLINKLFLDKCRDFYPDMQKVTENYSKARSIKQLGINYNY